MAKKESVERAVVVCTAKRAVVFGYTHETPDAMIGRGIATIGKARMCTFWAKETHGVMGLAGIGPQKGSRVGPRVPEVTLESLTAVMVCSPEAVTAWEAETWT
jgi:hypothetical protein